MENVRTRELYSSSNGDRWHLCRNTSGKVFVLHQANIPAGGRISQIELGDFLARGYGPEQQALLQMIGSLIELAPAETAEDANPGELLTGEVAFAAPQPRGAQQNTQCIRTIYAWPLPPVSESPGSPSPVRSSPGLASSAVSAGAGSIRLPIICKRACCSGPYPLARKSPSSI